jgi:predicted O-methyltransferase YrrM
MEGSYIDKALRLATHLVSHPTHIKFYFTKSINKSATPLSFELPWISYSAIKFLDGYLKPSFSVAEYGGGGSTLYFAQRVSSVLCVETSKEWIESLNCSMDKQSIKNVDLIYSPFNFENSELINDSSFLHSINKNTYDVILIDNYDPNSLIRPSCFYHAEKYINKGGIIIVDDSWRYSNLRENNNAMKFREFRSIGPCRPGVTTTDIYFY